MTRDDTDAHQLSNRKWRRNCAAQGAYRCSRPQACVVAVDGVRWQRTLQRIAAALGTRHHPGPFSLPEPREQTGIHGPQTTP
jgi:hypothetical protein